MKPFDIDLLEAAVFACGFVLAVMLVRTIKARQVTQRSRRGATTQRWMPAAVALAALIALWLYLS